MQLDTSAFTRRLTADDRRIPLVAPRVIGEFVFAFGLFAFGLMMLGVVSTNSSGSGLAWLLPVLMLLTGAGTFWYSLERLRRLRRLAMFAHDNGFERIPVLADPPHNGWLFNRGRNRRASQVMRRSGERPLELGTYQYTTGSGKSQRTTTFGYIRMPLIAPLPHVFADCKNSGTSANVVGELPKGETIKLANNRIMSLHAPPGYEQDAKALFQPYELSLLSDQDPIFDAETVGAELYLYMREHAWIGAEGWQRVNEVLAGLEPTVQRWASWRDLRGGAMSQEVAASAAAPMPFAGVGGEGWYMPPGVAPQGRRMSARFNVWVWVLTGVIVLMFLALQFAGWR